MKYVVMSAPLGKSGMRRELPVVFPDALTHRDVADALKRGCPELRGAVPVAAGFLSSMSVGEEGACHGKSESLGGLASRGTVDDALMRMLDYGHGIVG